MHEPFADEHLETALATILHLPRQEEVAPDPASVGVASVIQRAGRPRSVSVVAVTALGMGCCGLIVALFAGSSHTLTDGSAPHSPGMRKVITLAIPAVVRLPSASPPAPGGVEVVTKAYVESRQPKPTRLPDRIAAAPVRRIVSSTRSRVPADETALPMAPIEMKVASVDASSMSAVDTRDSSPAATPPPAQLNIMADEETSRSRDRRDSVDAIRALRRQW